ncbi:MAG TPA: hypothetical protein PLC48_09780 [Ferruginibacter sp.]|nr:hypothetical protein [Ferruginibacter sp.]
MSKAIFRFTCYIIICTGIFSSCKKDSFITTGDANLVLSSDSIKFDTVFTTAGSVTRSFKIFNDNNQKLLLSKIKLMGGSSSAFHININGQSTPEANDIEVAANDSIYVFVSLTVDPTSGNLPFIISDSILINYNGNNRYVQLQAYGQNAHFIRNGLITGNVTWTATLPWVILGSLRVDTTASLTIEAGARIYLHADAPLIVDGTLIIQGEKNNEVQFRGDRLDAEYRDLPASWPGIYFRNSSKDNTIRFAILKNANQALVVEGPSVNSNPKLTLQQCVIDNAFEAGIICVNSSLDASNTLVSNCGNNIYIEGGGNYQFTHCTVAAYSNSYFLHTNPVLAASNYRTDNGGITTADMSAIFRNCIFWGDNGSVDDEIFIDKEGANPFSVSFENCLIKLVNDPADAILTSVIRNEDPLFDSIDITHKYYDFRTSKNPLAPGVDQGVLTSLPKDLDDQPRNAGLLPDMGSYEKQ